MSRQKSFSNAVKWAYTANWGERGFTALFTFILAALLGPHDFGVVSISYVYITFLQLFLDQGFVAALIQRSELDREHMDAVFWMDMALSAVLVLLSIVFGRWWGVLNHAPQAGPVISVLSLCIPIEALAVVQKALLSRELDFKSLSIRSNASVLISGVVGIGMALMGFGVWALVAQQLTKDTSALALLWKLSPWRPRFDFSWKHLRDLMGFSVSTFIAQMANFADRQVGAIVLGILFGPVAVGLYKLADRLVSSVVTMAMSSIQAVSLPEFSRKQNDPVQLRNSALICVRLSSTATLPALAGLAAVSGPLMTTLGAKWTPASDVVKLLCFSGMAVVFAYFTGPLMQALSKTRLLALLEWARTGLGIAFLLIAGFLVRGSTLKWQIVGIASARLFAEVFVVAPVFVCLFTKFCRLPWQDFASAAAPSATASVAIVGAIEAFYATGWLKADAPAVLVAVAVALGAAVGTAALLGLDGQLRATVLAAAGKVPREGVAFKELI